MNKRQLLPFISDKDLFEHVKRVLDKAERAAENAEVKLYSNAVDPFSAVFDAMRQNISLAEWFEQEKARQIQKTMQNAIGDFHESVIGSMPNWKKLPVGNVIDVANKKQKIIAEIKNKWNTTKGSDKKTLYDNLKSQLDSDEYSGYIGYYVETVPKGKKTYDEPFTPPDNVLGESRSENANIRVIDGKTFYTLASGYEDALVMLYQKLPGVINEILGIKNSKEDPNLMELFKKTY